VGVFTSAKPFTRQLLSEHSRSRARAAPLFFFEVTSQTHVCSVLVKEHNAPVIIIDFDVFVGSAGKYLLPLITVKLS